MNGYREGGHANLTLRQIFRHLANNNRRDHRLVALHVDDDRIIAETAFLNHFRQTLSAGLVIGASHAHLPPSRFNRLRHVRVIGCHDDAVCTRFARTLQDMHNHGLAVDVYQRFTRQTR